MTTGTVPSVVRAGLRTRPIPEDATAAFLGVLADPLVGPTAAGARPTKVAILKAILDPAVTVRPVPSALPVLAMDPREGAGPIPVAGIAIAATAATILVGPTTILLAEAGRIQAAAAETVPVVPIELREITSAMVAAGPRSTLAAAAGLRLVPGRLLVASEGLIVEVASKARAPAVAGSAGRHEAIRVAVLLVPGRTAPLGKAPRKKTPLVKAPRPKTPTMETPLVGQAQASSLEAAPLEATSLPVASRLEASSLKATSRLETP